MPLVKRSICLFCALVLLGFPGLLLQPVPAPANPAPELSTQWSGRSAQEVLESLQLAEWYPIQWFCQPRVGRMLSRRNNHKLTDLYQEVRSTIAGCQAMAITVPYYAAFESSNEIAAEV